MVVAEVVPRGWHLDGSTRHSCYAATYSVPARASWTTCTRVTDSNTQLRDEW
uniref:Uncharacterized protein n=1 Tax=Daucus carota subsp. sativus TaxID=79200 RepID=A0A164TPW4_DAUCS